ncbi:phage/plasmid primase, P4 family [Bacteroides fragilis]|uniref:DNA primase family protein n=1 Tax=Bacteroides fragilis TaxID=817 RepID=UPI001C6FDE1B|nr:phage/plasmid primase, P4 family [Bacteroides fragilis]MBW9279505.1 DNA primase [Bacteroides fragilis]
METNKIMDNEAINEKVNIDDVDFDILAQNDKMYNSILKSQSVAYITRLTRVISQIDALTKLIESTEEPDYAMIYYGDNEKVLKRIKELRHLIEITSDYEKKQKYTDDLSKFEPDLDEKYAILIDVMLKTAEDIGLGFGINNTFPYFYNGTYWEATIEEFAKEIITLIAQNCGFNYYKVRLVKNITKLYRQFCASGYIPEPDKELGIVKINLKNGRLTIKNGKPKFEKNKFSSKDFFKYQLGFDFTPEAKADKFFKYLNRVLPEKEAQMVLAEYLGYIFTNVKMEKCVVLVGPGHSGKSVLHDIVNAMFGIENVSSYTLNNLCDPSGYYRAQLGNVLLNYCSELGGKGCNPDMVKQLISGEPVSCRSPYGAPLILRNYCKFMFNTNLIPQDTEKTNAYFRRFIFIIFDQIISKEEKNDNLAKEIIKEEMSGVFNWVLDGLDRFMKNGNFTESKHINDAMEEIKRDADSAREFMEDSYTTSLDKHEELKELYGEYRAFCADNGYKSSSNREFSRRLKEMGYVVEGGHTNNQTWVFCKRKGDLEDSEIDAVIPDSMK